MGGPAAYADPALAGFSGTWVHPYCFATAGVAANMPSEVACAVRILDWMASSGNLVNPPYLLHTPPIKYAWAKGACLYLPNFKMVDTADNSHPWQDSRFALRNSLHRRHALESTYEPVPGRWATPAVNVLFGPVNWLIQWYLMLSYLYYKLDITVVPDTYYDQLCTALWYHLSYDSVQPPHTHRHLIDVDTLAGGSGYHIKEFPLMVSTAASALLSGIGALEMSA